MSLYHGRRQIQIGCTAIPAIPILKIACFLMAKATSTMMKLLLLGNDSRRTKNVTGPNQEYTVASRFISGTHLIKKTGRCLTLVKMEMKTPPIAARKVGEIPRETDCMILESTRRLSSTMKMIYHYHS